MAKPGRKRIGKQAREVASIRVEPRLKKAIEKDDKFGSVQAFFDHYLSRFTKKIGL